MFDNVKHCAQRCHLTVHTVSKLIFKPLASNEEFDVCPSQQPSFVQY